MNSSARKHARKSTGGYKQTLDLWKIKKGKNA